MNKELAVMCRKDEESLLLDYTASTKWEDIADLEWSTAEVMEVMRQYRTLVEEKFTSTNTQKPSAAQIAQQFTVALSQFDKGNCTKDNFIEYCCGVVEQLRLL